MIIDIYKRVFYYASMEVLQFSVTIPELCLNSKARKAWNIEIVTLLIISRTKINVLTILI